MYTLKQTQFQLKNIQHKSIVSPEKHLNFYISDKLHAMLFDHFEEFKIILHKSIVR